MALQMGDRKGRKQRPECFWGNRKSEKGNSYFSNIHHDGRPYFITSPPGRKSRSSTTKPCVLGSNTWRSEKRAHGQPAVTEVCCPRKPPALPMPTASHEATSNFSVQTLCKLDLLSFCKTRHVSELTLTHIRVWRCYCVFIQLSWR